MLSRIFWVGIAGIALVAGMVLQDGPRIFSWSDDRSDVSAKKDHSIADNVDRAVDRAVEGSFDKMTVVGTDGKEMAVPRETKRALAEAVGRLVKAEANLALLRARDGSPEELQAVEARRAKARADVDRLKAEIKRADKAAVLESQAISDEVRSQIREEIRAEIRDAVRN